MYDDNLFAIDTTGIDAMGGYEIFPAGLYPAVMISASKKPTKNNDGAFLECVYQIIDGEMQGKKFTSRLNLWNQNTQAVDIAKRELKSLRLALGLHDQEGRTSEFINKPLVLNITVKPRKDKPDQAENNLIGIEPYNGAPAQPAPVQMQMPMQMPQQPAAIPQQYVQAPVQHPPQAMAPRLQPQPAAPAYPPAAGATPPWMVGAR